MSQGITHAKFHTAGCIPYPPMPETSKSWPFSWPKHGPSDRFFLSLNWYPQVCFMPNLRFLASTLSDLFNFPTWWVTHSVSNSFSEWLSEMWNSAPGQRPGVELIIFKIIKWTSWHIGAVQLANWSILVFMVIIWNVSYIPRDASCQIQGS